MSLRYNWDRWDYLEPEGYEGITCRVQRDYMTITKMYEYYVTIKKGRMQVTIRASGFKHTDEAKAAFEEKLPQIHEIFKGL